MTTSAPRDAVIVGAIRTPVGRRNGALAGVHPVDLSAMVLNGLTTRHGIDPSAIDDVIWGCVGQIGEQAINIGRNAVLAAGWPDQVPATTVDRQCGSSQQAVHFAAASVIAGHYELVVAGGVEVMSRIPMGATLGEGLGSPLTQGILDRYGVPHFHQGLGAESIAAQWSMTREQLDEFAAQSHQRAAAAIDSGVFTAEILPVQVADGTVNVDGGVRPDTSVEKLATLSPAFGPEGLITAGSSSQISDGAAALLITTSEHAKKLGLLPLARIHTAVVVGDDPVKMLTGPIPATAKALEKSKLSISDIGTFEVNEAFAPVVLAWMAETGADEKLTNPSGGAIALGHPLGASGARLMTTMVHRMQRDNIRFGLQTMCEGGGLANATILQRLVGC